MKRLHLNLRVTDLDASVPYYTALFGAEPTKRRGDYAKWDLAEPSVNFALTLADEVHPKGVEHLGVEVTEQAELSEALQRAEAAGSLEVEGRVTCCYADSSKGWSADPDGVAWELFLTHGDAEAMRGAGAATEDVMCCTQKASLEVAPKSSKPEEVLLTTNCCGSIF